MGGNLDDVAAAFRLPDLGGACCAVEVLECFLAIRDPLELGVVAPEFAPAVDAWACKPEG